MSHRTYAQVHEIEHAGRLQTPSRTLFLSAVTKRLRNFQNVAMQPALAWGRASRLASRGKNHRKERPLARAMENCRHLIIKVNKFRKINRFRVNFSICRFFKNSLSGLLLIMLL